MKNKKISYDTSIKLAQQKIVASILERTKKHKEIEITIRKNNGGFAYYGNSTLLVPDNIIEKFANIDMDTVFETDDIFIVEIKDIDFIEDSKKELIKFVES